MTFKIGNRGADHWKWNGGVRLLANGYLVRYRPGHPRAGRHSAVYEHVLVAEKALGRYLPIEHPVHHVDLNRRNNANSNLVICQDGAYHKLLHSRQRALDACGNASAKRCSICHGYGRQEDIRNPHVGQYRHASCHAARQIARYHQKRYRTGGRAA